MWRTRQRAQPAVEPVPAPDPVPTLRGPRSQACTQAQMDEPAYLYWCAAIGEVPRYHRKQWEFCYILQALVRCGKLAPDMRGLGFGVGEEPLAALMAQRGVRVLATDLDHAAAAELGWVATDQHAARSARRQQGRAQRPRAVPGRGV